MARLDRMARRLLADRCYSIEQEFSSMKRLNLIALATALLFGFNAAIAQEEQSSSDMSGQQSAQQQPTKDVSDKELQQFADAQAELAKIQQEYSQKLQNVEDPERATSLQRQANEEMKTAVKDVGLNVQSFNEIAMAIQNSPELQQKLSGMLQGNQQQ
jgi:flagellar biosynthesis component FlhA